MDFEIGGETFHKGPTSSNKSAGTSKKTELKLVGVTRASLEELLLDYQDFLRQGGLAPWPKGHPTVQAVRRLVYEKHRTMGRVRPMWMRRRPGLSDL